MAENENIDFACFWCSANVSDEIKLIVDMEDFVNRRR